MKNASKPRLPHGRGSLSVLIDETAESLAAAVAQHNPEAVGNSGDGAAVGVAKRVANRFLAHLFRRPAPDIAVLIAQSQMIAVTEAIEMSVGTLFFEIEKAAWHFSVNAAPFEDTMVNH
jgi:hypothetical protein